MNDRSLDTVLKEQQLDAVGGINLLGTGMGQRSWAAAPTDENHVLDPLIDKVERVIDGTKYVIGRHVLLTEIPDNFESTFSFESTAEYNHKSTVQANAKGSYGAFSGGFSTTFSRETSILETHYAAIHNEFRQLWSVKLEVEEHNFSAGFKKALGELPKLEKALANVEQFVPFFRTYGTDVVTQVIVGGNATFSMLIDKSSVTSKSDLEATVNASYGTFVTSASTSISDEQKNTARKLSTKIRSSGGTESIHFDASNPASCNADYEKWRKSLSKAPRVVDISLKPIQDCLPQSHYATQHDAIEEARKWYMGFEATITANWQGSTISVSEMSASPKQTAQNTGGAPALHIMIVGKNRIERSRAMLYAPERGADAAAFTAFWKSATEMLAAVTDRHEMVLLATERWPRDARYFPSSDLQAQLLRHGASRTTLSRWDKLVRNMQPCSIAGMTYVLAGRGMSSEDTTDFVVAGFGTPNQPNIRPTIDVTARIVAESKSSSRVLLTKVIEETNTKLQTISNVDGDRLALAASDSNDKTLIEMVKAGHRTTDGDTYLGQYWYFLRLPRYEKLQNTHILINFETGACLQGFNNESRCMLFPYGDDGRFQQDDVLWDVRGNPEQTHFEHVHYHNQHKDLVQIGNMASVRPWMEPFMLWSIKRFDRFRWQPK